MPTRQTDDQGDAVFALDLAGYENSTFRLSALAEGMDAGGGRSVMADASLLFSPLESVVGWRSDADLNYLPQHGKAGWTCWPWTINSPSWTWENWN